MRGYLDMLLRCLGAVTTTSTPDTDYKQVVHTPWWPPGSEQTAESVGIVSRGRVFMTGMMAVNATDDATAREEVHDIRDIAEAAGTSLDGLTYCLVNAPRGESRQVREVIERALGVHHERMALTVVEMVGEYGGMFRFQIKCGAVQPSLLPKTVIRNDAGATAVAAAGVVHVSIATNDTASALLNETAALLRRSGGAGLDALLQCTIFAHATALVETRALAAALRTTTAVPPALTAVVAPSDSGRITMMCVALAGGAGAAASKVAVRTADAYAVRAGGLVFADGLAASNATGTGADAYARLATLLHAAGSDAAAVLDCSFFLRSVPQSGFPQQLFAGFHDFFNVAHPPPPCRAEYVAHGVATPAGAADAASDELAVAASRPPLLVECVAAEPTLPAVER